MGRLAEAKREAESALRALGDPASQPWSAVKERSWARVWRTSTERGRVFLKVLPERVHHEVAVTRIVGECWPEGSVAMLAADERAGWMLLGDGGVTVREADGDDTAQLLTVLGEVFAWKARMGERVDALLAAGCPDRRLEALPELAAALAQRHAARLDPEEHRSLDPAREAERCDRVASLGLAPSLHHDDIHLGNAFPSGRREAPRYRLFDWGDAAVSHPLFDLLEGAREARTDSETRTRLERAYLEPFGPVDPALLDDAMALARLVRAATWSNLDELLSDAERARFADPVRGALKAFAHA